jgi:asparagine synthase (glutamine-hydrolysing)
LAVCTESPALDRVAVAVQSLLGWQLALRTPYAGVSKLPPGAFVTLKSGNANVQETTISPTTRAVGASQHGARDAADLLRAYLAGYLDDHPDAILQLTGGLDSRVLLGAIPPARRTGLEALTLAVPGSTDVMIASDLAERYGMRHRIVTFDGLDAISPKTAHRMCVDAALSIECSADPLASASIAYAEAQVEQRPRLAGLGGEVARGFYYFGSNRHHVVNRRRVEHLANWRLFPNGSVPPTSLSTDFAQSARRTTIDEIYAIVAGTGLDWLRATDEFYLGQRMHRWAGALASSTCFDRAATNPMLDYRFLEIARQQLPRDKKNMRFLSRILIELDPELAAIPLDGRPAPATYARSGPESSARMAALTARKVARKARQRMTRQRRSPAGGQILATKVVEHWRAYPSSLDGVRSLDIFDAGYLDRLLAGTAPVDTASVALLVNLEVATSSPDLPV